MEADDNEWKVKASIGEQLDRRGRGHGQPQWLVRWKGFGAEHDFWVNKDNVFTPDLIRQFEQRRTRR